MGWRGSEEQRAGSRKGTDTDCLSDSHRDTDTRHRTSDLSCRDWDTSDKSSSRSGFTAICPGGVFWPARKSWPARRLRSLAAGKLDSRRQLTLELSGAIGGSNLKSRATRALRRTKRVCDLSDRVRGSREQEPGVGSREDRGNDQWGRHSGSAAGRGVAFGSRLSAVGQTWFRLPKNWIGARRSSAQRSSTSAERFGNLPICTVPF